MKNDKKVIKNNLKNGISLIVLVVVIVVIIILSVSIILSIATNNPIENAKKAVDVNNKSSYKEYINLLKADWISMSDTQKSSTNAKTCIEYVNKKLEESGYGNVTYSEDDKIYLDLSNNVKKVISQGLKIGDKVSGYIIEQKTLPTSGDENTAPSKVEVGKTVQNISNKIDFTWRFLGINKKGEIEIIPELTDNAPKIKLSGKGGYLNGPNELNEICKKLYSTEKGTARSIDNEDVINLLEYSGGKGGYYNREGKYTQLKEPLTIGEIAKQKGVEFGVGMNTPDQKDINTYKADYYYIRKTSTQITTDEVIKDLIYDDTVTYWLASTCNYVHFKSNFVYNSLLIVYPSIVNASNVFTTNYGSADRTNTLRPIVSLNTDTKLMYNEQKAEWIIEE